MVAACNRTKIPRIATSMGLAEQRVRLRICARDKVAEVLVPNKLIALHANKHDGHGEEVNLAKIKELVEQGIARVLVFGESDLTIKLNIRFGEVFHRCTEDEWQAMMSYLLSTHQVDARKAIEKDRTGQKLNQIAYAMTAPLAVVGIFVGPPVGLVSLGILSMSLLTYMIAVLRVKLYEPPTPFPSLYLRNCAIGLIWVFGILYFFLSQLWYPQTDYKTTVLGIVFITPFVVLFFYYRWPELKTSFEGGKMLV